MAHRFHTNTALPVLPRIKHISPEIYVIHKNGPWSNDKTWIQAKTWNVSSPTVFGKRKRTSSCPWGCSRRRTADDRAARRRSQPSPGWSRVGRRCDIRSCSTLASSRRAGRSCEGSLPSPSPAPDGWWCDWGREREVLQTRPTVIQMGKIMFGRVNSHLYGWDPFLWRLTSLAFARTRWLMMWLGMRERFYVETRPIVNYPSEWRMDGSSIVIRMGKFTIGRVNLHLDGWDLFLWRLTSFARTRWLMMWLRQRQGFIHVETSPFIIRMGKFTFGRVLICFRHRSHQVVDDVTERERGFMYRDPPIRHSDG